MSKIKYNKDFFEFYMSDDSNVQAWQVEETNHWTLEIFPPNQTSESFNKAEFDGWLEINQEPVETTPYSKPTYNRFDINFPPNWTEELKEEFLQSLQQEINEVVVVDNNPICDKI